MAVNHMVTRRDRPRRGPGACASPDAAAASVTPDGAVWWGATPYQPEEMDGLVRFDGETWAQFLRGTGLAPHGESIAFAPDGSLWALVTGGLHVITPEAVAE